ncbi:MAG: M48 family metalloprotease [Gammaproteobacteria bacterium]|nr:M48 family metalloprotease [Gammaproteobacteria bacterium]
MKAARILVAALLAGTLAACGTNPVTGKKEIQFISESSEIQIGEQNYAPMRQSEGGDVNVMPELSAYVSEVGQKLAAVADRKLPYEFVVLNNSVPNAWCLPGGKIAVNRGLLTELHSEAELAAVLGHEIVHGAARHGAKAQERGTLLQAGMVVAQVGLGASRISPTAANILLAGSGVGAQMVQLKFSREQESEADYYGMLYMKRAGYDPAAAVTLQETFVRLSKESGRSQNWLEGLFASHPPSAERVADNRQSLARIGAGGDLGAERYPQRLAALTAARPAYNKYDQAVAAANKKDYSGARQLAAEAAALLPREGRFAQLQGDTLLVEKKPAEALPYYERAIALNPGYYGSYLGAGTAQYRLGNKTKAREWLQKSHELLPTAPSAYFLGVLAREGGDASGALQYFRAAAGSPSEYGQLAATEYLRMDLPHNPGNYLATGTQRDATGRALLLIENRSPAALTGIQLTPVFVDALGNVTRAGQQRSLRSMTLAAGQRAALDIGLGTLDDAQLQAVRFRIDAAQLAAADP